MAQPREDRTKEDRTALDRPDPERTIGRRMVGNTRGLERSARGMQAESGYIAV